MDRAWSGNRPVAAWPEKPPRGRSPKSRLVPVPLHCLFLYRLIRRTSERSPIARKKTTMDKSKNADDGGRRAGIVGRKTPLPEELWAQLPSSVQAALWVVVEEYEW